MIHFEGGSQCQKEFNKKKTFILTSFSFILINIYHQNEQNESKCQNENDTTVDNTCSN